MKIDASMQSQGSEGSFPGLCPHCKTKVAFTPIRVNNMADLVLENGQVWLCHRSCPNCNGYVLVVAQNREVVETYPSLPSIETRQLPSEVTSPYREDFEEAVRVFDISPKASAALSRRLLQRLIRDKGQVKHGSLSYEIDQLIETGGLSTSLQESVDAIRNIGNFAAHPIKDTNTGEIVDVEPGEAKWNLDVLEDLFDHFIVKADRLKKRRASLNQKLESVGKPPMK